MNDNLLKKIYEDVIVYEAEAIDIKRSIEAEVKNIMMPYVSKMDGKEKESFEDMCYDISYSAELGGFRLGIKYAAKVLAEILKK